MTAAPDHGADTTPAHILRVRGQIGDAAASTSDLLDLLTAGLAEDDACPSGIPSITPIARGTAAAAVET